MMQYKGYVSRIEFGAEAKFFHGEVVNICDVITFQDKFIEELKNHSKIPLTIIWNSVLNVTSSQKNHFRAGLRFVFPQTTSQSNPRC
ncbi:MAG: hypothetical protein OZ917_09930 [Candidatus Brocadiaceae bacterium]|nr:hypothetical protein [Candidatus Brocadiaceae bacterium]